MFVYPHYKSILTVLVVGPIPCFVGPEVSNTIVSCVGSLIVLAVVGSMSLILANCEPELSPIDASVHDWRRYYAHPSIRAVGSSKMDVTDSLRWLLDLSVLHGSIRSN